MNTLISSSLSGRDKIFGVSRGWSECILHGGKKWIFLTQRVWGGIAGKYPLCPLSFYLWGVSILSCPCSGLHHFTYFGKWDITGYDTSRGLKGAWAVEPAVLLLQWPQIKHDTGLGEWEVRRAGLGDCRLKQSHSCWPSGIGWEILPVACHCDIYVCYTAVADWDKPHSFPKDGKWANKCLTNWEWVCANQKEK